MLQEQALIGHSRGEALAITWGLARYRDGKPPVSGQLARLLEGPEIDTFAKSDPRVPVEKTAKGERRYPLNVFLDSFSGTLAVWQVNFPFLEEPSVTGAWYGVDWHVRRAWICLAILADRDCPLLYPELEREFVEHNQRLDRLARSLGAPARGKLAEIEYGKEMDREARRFKQTHRPTMHLIRPGGFVETDLGWMAGVKTRAERVRVREKLEKWGIIRREKKPMKQVRFFPANRQRRSGVAVELRASMREDVRSIGKLALLSAPGRRQKAGEPEKWDYLWQVPGSPVLVVGSVPTPSARRFLERHILDFRQGLILAAAGKTRERGYRKWLFRAAAERVKELYLGGPVLVIPL